MVAGTGVASLMLVGASLGAPAQPRPGTAPSVNGSAVDGLVVDGSTPGQGVTAAIGHSLVALDGRMVHTPVDAKQAGEMAKLALDGKIAPTRAEGALVPTGLMTAYTSAQTRLRTLRPQCNLPWWLLAGIGKIESGHAYGGAVDATGKTKGAILGPRLDGTTPGTATIRDTDGGALDGDTQFDRAVGPCSFCRPPGVSTARTAMATGWPTRTMSTMRPSRPGSSSATTVATCRARQISRPPSCATTPPGCTSAMS